MTIQEFNKTGFSGNMAARYNGKLYDVMGVDFEEAVIAIDEKLDGSVEQKLSWKRCENIESLYFMQNVTGTK